MPKHLYLRLLLAAPIAMSPAHADDDLPAELPPMLETAALSAAETTGRMLFVHDRAAAVATDAVMQATDSKPDARMQGWVTAARGDAIDVTFFGESDGAMRALYRVLVDKEGVVVGPAAVLETPQPLTAFEAAAAGARINAMKADFEPCRERYNSVVLPLDDDATRWAVYLLPGTTDAAEVPLGGSFRVEVAADGTAAVRAYTRTCIVLENQPQAAGLMITHLLDPVPTDVHVFWSLWSGKPMYVATPPHGTVWSIEAGDVELVERRSAEQ